MRRLSIFAAIIFATGFFQAWFMGINLSTIATKHSNGALCDAYTGALASGQSYLRVQPDGPLPPASHKYQILDASYYRDHVYLYFGITPFATLLVPWFKTTGTFLSESMCILVFEQIGYFMYGSALILIFRNDRRTKIDWIFAASLLTTIVAGGSWSLIARPDIYEIEVASGYACFASTVACLAAARTFRKGTKSFLGAAAFFLGVTMGSRPNYAPAVAVIAVAIGYYSWQSEYILSRKVRASLLCVAPLVLIGLILAIWNYMRFANIFEFGYKYTGFAQNNAILTHFSSGNIIYNLYRYLLGAFRIGHYFPFIDGIRDGPFEHQKGTNSYPDQVYGCLILFPVLFYTFFSMHRKQMLIGVLLLAAAGNLVLLSGLGYSTYRYPVDYLGAFAFAAALGIFNIARSANRVARFCSVGLLIPILSWSIVGCVCEAASIGRTTNLFDISRPIDFERLSRPFNAVAYRLEKLEHTGPRNIRINLMMPDNKYGHVEPILVAGDNGLQDFVYFYYISPGDIQVGFESTGYGGIVSASHKLDYMHPHIVELSLGSFLPPDSHPLLESLSIEDRSIARRLIHIEIDKQVVLEGIVNFHQTRSRIFIGESPDDAAFGARFSGKLLGIDRPLIKEGQIFPKWRASMFGPVTIVLTLHPGSLGVKQPLVSIGNRPQGGIFYIEQLAASKIRFGWKGYNQTSIYSCSVSCNYDRPHKIEFCAGSLLPPVDDGVWPASRREREADKRMICCELDGVEVWRAVEETPDASPSSVIIGENGLMLTDVADMLNADITSVTREVW
jgi:hypothetical protein